MNLPRIALRDDSKGDLDDVVVENVEMFRAEMMSDDMLWLCCHLDNGEAIHFYVTADSKLNFSATDVPAYEDWDA